MMTKAFYLLTLTLVAWAKKFSWLDVQPLRSLVFHDCFDHYQCARLDVPMDWNRTDGKGSRVAVAIIKLPAKVPVIDPRYGGAILLNPGGPGGSGVGLLFRDGSKIQQIVDASLDPSKPSVWKDDEKFFDVISFDPRGVNNTTPQVICFPDFAAREAWQRALAAEGTMGSSDVAFATKWARYLAVTESCVQRMNTTSQDEEDLLEHVNTAPVVGDMVAIVEALGEWREAEAIRLVNELEAKEFPEPKVSLMAPRRFWSRNTQEVIKDSSVSFNREKILEKTRWNKGEEKLLYWGFSYGTVLGATFAAMQPQRVGRVILDGVVDGEDYYSAEFKMNLNDADDVFAKFFHFCSLAGPSGCPFAEKDGESAADLRKKFDILLEDVKLNPIPVYTDTSTLSLGPDIITSSNLLIYTRTSLYSPLKNWPILASLLHDLQYRNGTSFSVIKNSDFSEMDTSCTACANPYAPDCQGPKLGEDPVMSASVWCADGLPASHEGPEDFRNTTLRALRQQSALFGDIWATLRMQCVGWRVRPKWKYSGIFQGIETSHPVLWIGTSDDHVCPIINAHKMASSFPGSVALEQTSVGHCSLSAPSLCTASYVRLYFQTGELPHPDTICGVDRVPFENVETASARVADRELWEVVKDFEGF